MESIAVRFAQRRTYSLAQLIDGRILAFDRQVRSPVYLMTPRSAADGRYFPARSGSVDVRGGFVTNVTPDAASTSGLIESAARQGSALIPPARGIGTIVDLKNQQLLLIRNQQAFILNVVPALDGAYAAAGVGVVEVRGGTSLLKSSKPGGGIHPPPRGGGGGGVPTPGMPDFDWPDDFAP